MSTTLTPVITDAGLQAVFNAQNTGITLDITHIALGDNGYTPTNSRTLLQHEVARFPIADGTRVSNTQVHLTALADGVTEFWVREVGFLLSDGTLLAVWSDPTQALAFKSNGVDLLLAFDLVLSALPANSVTVQGTGQSLNLVLAEEMTRLGSAQIDTLHRGMQRQTSLDAHAQQLTVAQADRANIKQDLVALDNRQINYRNGELLVNVGTAAAVIDNLQRQLQQNTSLDNQSAQLAANKAYTDQVFIAQQGIDQRVTKNTADIVPIISTYVDAIAGNDTNSGDINNPVKTIDEALTRVKPDMRIYLMSGQTHTLTKTNPLITGIALGIMAYGTGAKPILTALTYTDSVGEQGTYGINTRSCSIDFINIHIITPVNPTANPISFVNTGIVAMSLFTGMTLNLLSSDITINDFSFYNQPAGRNHIDISMYSTVMVRVGAYTPDRVLIKLNAEGTSTFQASLVTLTGFTGWNQAVTGALRDATGSMLNITTSIATL